MYLWWSVSDKQPRWKVLYFRPKSLRPQVRRGRVCCNAVKSDFFGGIKSRAEGSSPLTIPTLCRGSAPVSVERARSCRCPRAGRKPGITMAECFLSTTTPGKLHGLTPEIGRIQARESWDHTHTHTLATHFNSNSPKLGEELPGRSDGGDVGAEYCKRRQIYLVGLELETSSMAFNMTQGEDIEADESDGVWQQRWPPRLLKRSLIQTRDVTPRVAYGPAARQYCLQ